MAKGGGEQGVGGEVVELQAVADHGGRHLPDGDLALPRRSGGLPVRRLSHDDPFTRLTRSAASDAD